MNTAHDVPPYPPLGPHFLATPDPQTLIISGKTPNFLLCGWWVTWEHVPPADSELCVACFCGVPYLARYVGEGEVILNCPHWGGVLRLMTPDRILGRVTGAYRP